jgi:hypothetical protein
MVMRITTAIERDVAQPGSAPDWGSGGRGFESRHPDQFYSTENATLASVERRIFIGGKNVQKPRTSHESFGRAQSGRLWQ